MISIIANNCTGGYIYMDSHLQYGSPTMWTQILPQEFPKFCKNLKHYMECELKEYKDVSETHMEQINKLLHQPPYFPLGIVDDVVILFQHYTSFEQAKEKWDKRKKRIDYDHIGYVFCLLEPYIDEAIEFESLDLKNSFLFTRSFDIPGKHIRFEVPEGCEYLGANPHTGQRCFYGNTTINEVLSAIRGN